MRKLHLLLPLLFMVFSLNKASGQVVQALPVNFLSPGDLFGVSVDINGNGDYIVVGAPGHINYADVPPDQEGVAFVYYLSGNTWTLQDTLDVPAFEVMDGVGSAVAINTNGDRIAVGAPAVGNDQGDVRVFKRIGPSWAMIPSELHHNGNSGDNTGAGPGDNFGAVVALNGSGYYMAVGSPSFQNQYGRANVCYYNIFLNKWEQYESLDNPTPDKSDYFGCSMALDATGNFLVIGALGEDNGNGNNNIDEHYGAVYYYTRSGTNTWTKIQDIAPLGLQPQSMFGASVDLNKTGDTLIVGAPGHKGSGAAFLFKKMGGLWVPTDVISAHNPVTGDLFGAAVAISGTGDIAMIGAPLRDTASVTDIGSTYLFSYVNPTVHWGQQNNLSLPPGYQSDEGFGFAVALARNLFLGVVGSPFWNNSGAAYVVWPSALPVTWLSFRAEPVDDAVNLYWSTASESNNEGFGVERSANGRDWETLGFVPGAGTTSEVQTYHFTDESPITSHQSLIYYRLKQTDYDGAFEYSPIRVVEFGDAGLGVRVYPNPASDWAILSFAEPTTVRGTVQILHENGRLMAEYDIPPQTQDYQIRLAPLASGTYLLKVKVGALEWSNRLVVE